MARLILQHLCKSFPGREEVCAVKDLSLTVEDGELLVLLGPSGCGKTTTLRLIAGLDKATSGQILLEGEAIEDKLPRDRNVAMAFQYPALLPHLNVLQNLTLGLTLRGLNKRDSAERSNQLAELLGIKPLLLRQPETLSGGQQQRVALARALITRPRVLLLDEPLANLDPITRAELRGCIRSLQKEFGTTTVYVTHDQYEAAALADRIAIMNHGQVEQCGTAVELYENPATLFVARFFGPHEVNLVRGELHDGIFVRDQLRVALPSNRRNDAREMVLAFRPHELVLDPNGQIAGQIEAIENLGWTQFLRVSLGSITLRLQETATPRPGTLARFRLNSFFLFDAETGARVV